MEKVLICLFSRGENVLLAAGKGHGKFWSVIHSLYNFLNSLIFLALYVIKPIITDLINI